MDWRGRRSSALGRLETSQVNSILNPEAILGEPWRRRAQTCPVRRQPSKERGLLSMGTRAWPSACLTQQSVCSTEEPACRKTLPHHADLVRNLRAEKLEHQVTLEELQNLNAFFQEHEKQGRHLLDMEAFKCIMKQSLRSQNKSIGQIEQLFMKIDHEAVGRIQWDGFCTYLQLAYSEQAKALARQKEVSFLLPATPQRLSQGKSVLRILSVPDTLIMIREDGAISFWSLQLKLKRKRQSFGKSIHRKPRRVTDAVSMPPYNKMIIGTGRRELQIYELSNLEPYCQISGLEAVPLKLDYCSLDPDKCLILYGDDQGCVNILILASVGELLRAWKKMAKVEDMPSIAIHNAMASPNVKCIRWQVHGDWVTQLNYYDSMKAVISSSNHEPTALVIGVKAFSFCKRKNLLLTGGMDRIIRVWNPYLPGKPTGMLRSHAAPVTYIHIAEDNRVFSMSTDNTVKIWDLETHSCCFTASSKASGIKGEVTACLYLPGPRSLCVATDAGAVFHLKVRSAPEPHPELSHQEPVVCCAYNPAFRHVVSCSEASVVKVWDCETGRQLSEFIGAHGHAGITCLTFDSNGRRLITGGRDGCLKIWSYSNGHCLHTLKHDEKQSEVCDCTYMEVNQNKCIIAVGWDRRINVYFNHGHKEDILCVAQCPPFLLATSSYDGEIIVWNVISGHMYCKLNTPSSLCGPHHGEDSDLSVSCLAFLKTRAVQLDSVAASLIANGPGGSVTMWRFFSAAGLMANFTPSRWNAQVSSIVVTEGDELTYLADQRGFVHVYDIQEYGLREPEPQAPKNVTFWRAHVSMVTALQLIEEESLLLSSSLDCTVRLWSKDGAYLGTFGQKSSWDIFNPVSWSHARVPFETLTDPQSTPAHLMLETDAPWTQGHRVGQKEQGTTTEEETHAEAEKPSTLHSPEDSVAEAEAKEDKEHWPAFFHGRLMPAQSKSFPKVPEPRWPSVYQTLRCHDVACVSALQEKPDLSIIGPDLFHVNFLTQEREASLPGRNADPTADSLSER